MIVGSVLLVVAAGVLLGFGLVRLDAPLLYSSIGVSALAALALALGVRRAATVRAGQGTIAVRSVVPAPRPTPPVDRAARRSVGRARVVPVIDADKPVGDSWVVDEPSPEVVGAWDLARAGQLDAPVLVDQRAWFHRVGCADLRGQVAERVPIARAIDLGLVPCGRCRPVTTVLTDLDTAAGGPGD